MDKHDDDALLAADLQAGQPGAADRAWRRFSPTVNQVVSRFVASSCDTADLSQEVFLRFFMRIHELRNRRALRSFLIGICLGVAQNERRRANTRRRIRLATDGKLPEQPSGPFDTQARQALRRLCQVLADADDDDRRLFTARHVESLELADIAARTGWSLRKTKHRMAKANRRLGRRLRRDATLAEYAGALRA
jgi:RNA polymerase sigma-70 factor (ECF subfamily)